MPRARGGRTGRDIIGEYADPSSKVYAPVRRDGRHVDHLADAARFETEAEGVGGTAALLMAEEAAAPGLLHPRVKAPQPALPTNKKERHEAAVQKDLARVHELLRATKGRKASELPDASSRAAAEAAEILAKTAAGGLSGQEQAEAAGAGTAGGIIGKLPGVRAQDLPAWRRPRQRVERPSTPVLEGDDEQDDDDEGAQAVLLLQRLLRGRAVQNAMFEGKERRLALIEEIRQDIVDAEEERRLAQGEARALVAERVRQSGVAEVDSAGGEVATAALDFFAKELVRQQEAGRLARRVADAQESRRRREAEEAGAR